MTKELIKNDEIKDLALKIDEIIDKDSVYMQIMTRGADPTTKNLIDFKTFDEKKLTLVADKMPEINRANRAYGKQNSQTTSKLMSLHMIAQSPYRRMKQCLAQIERKRGALKENIFKLKEQKVELDRLLYEQKNLLNEIADVEEGKKDGDLILLDFDLQELDIKIQKMAADISDSNIYIEAALKEIGMFQEAYEEIRESYNIPEKWDEGDMERAEIEEHVKTAFLHAIRDVEMTGRLNVGTHEYLEQYGINPHTAYKIVINYLSSQEQNFIQQTEEGNGVLPIDTLYEFLDQMYEVFGNEYKKAMKRIGLKTLISEDFLYIEDKGD